MNTSLQPFTLFKKVVEKFNIFRPNHRHFLRKCAIGDENIELPFDT